ncbi:hypothetical protein QO004_005378 [Rhizobium mesoamericanum]|nr:hypothetical protein [Rhizobium mesoamericanum]
MVFDHQQIEVISSLRSRRGRDHLVYGKISRVQTGSPFIIPDNGKKAGSGLAHPLDKGALPSARYICLNAAVDVDFNGDCETVSL